MLTFDLLLSTDSVRGVQSGGGLGRHQDRLLPPQPLVPPDGGRAREVWLLLLRKRWMHLCVCVLTLVYSLYGGNGLLPQGREGGREAEAGVGRLLC